MPSESREERRARAGRITRALFRAHPDARCALDHRSPFELLVATILSAQSTDRVVNTVTPALFARLPDAPALAAAPPEQVERLVFKTGFYRQKAKTLCAMAAALVERHGGQVPRTLEELVRLPGVGRKTANVILGVCFDVPGIVVDTHVARLAGRMGLSRESDPEKIERDLAALVPRKDWTRLSHALIFHGRRICSARNPACEACPLPPDCPYPHRARAASARRTREAKARPRRRPARASAR
jgi:endonuclease-3